MKEVPAADIVELTTKIVATYVRNNSVPVAELSNLIRDVYAAMDNLGTVPEPEAAALPAQTKPAVPVKKSVTDDYIVCLDDGKKFKSLKRHLQTLGMTADQYREKWNLPKDYPMTAPSYARSRSIIAKHLGLGRRAKPAEIEAAMAEPVGDAPMPAREPEPTAASVPAPVAEKPKRGVKAKEAA